MEDLSEEAARAKIKVPAFEADTWMVHGVVLDKNRKGKSGLTVGLFDDKGKWRKEFGYACTDDHGYFSITYRPAGKTRVDTAAPPPLYLWVSDQNYKILLRDSEPLRVVIGRVDYRRLVLSDTPGVCAAPEPDHGEAAPVPGDVWMVQGRVVDESGKGLDGLTVTLFDEDLFFDDRLGTVKTKDGGYYEFHYKAEGFRDLIEANPDLYLQVVDKAGQQLCSSSCHHKV